MRAATSIRISGNGLTSGFITLPVTSAIKNIYPRLKAEIEKLDKEHSTRGNYFFYLATAPDFFGSIVEQLAAAGLMEEKRRLLAPSHYRKAFRARSGIRQNAEPAIAESRQ